MVDATYNVYVRENTSDDKMKIAEDVDITTFSLNPDDYSLDYGKEYLFSVEAVKNGVSKMSDERSILCGELWTPKKIPVDIWFDFSISENVSATNNIVDLVYDEMNVIQLKPKTGINSPTYNSTDKCISAVDGSYEYYLGGAIPTNITSKNPNEYTIFIVAKPKKTSSNIPTQSNSGDNFFTNASINSTFVQISSKTGDSYSGGAAIVLSLTTNVIALTETRYGYAPYNIARTHNVGSNVGIFSIVRSAGKIKSGVNGVYVNGASSNISVGFDQDIILFSKYTNSGKGYGDIHDVIIIKRAVTDTECKYIEGYLAHKWGLLDSLFDGHPFKNVDMYINTKKPDITTATVDINTASLQLEWDALNKQAFDRFNIYVSDTIDGINTITTPTKVVDRWKYSNVMTSFNDSYHIKIGAVKDGYEKISNVQSILNTGIDKYYDNVVLVSNMYSLSDNGSYIYDAKGHKFATFAGSAYIVDDVDTYNGKALSINGGLTTPTNTDWDFYGEFNIEFRFKFSSHQNYGGIICCATSNTEWLGWNILFNDSSNTLVLEINKVFQLFTTKILSPNTYYNVCVRRGSDNIVHILIDGVDVASSSYTSTITTGGSPLLVGIERTLACSTAMTLDRLRITNGKSRFGDKYELYKSYYTRRDIYWDKVISLLNFNNNLNDEKNRLWNATATPTFTDNAINPTTSAYISNTAVDFDWVNNDFTIEAVIKATNWVSWSISGTNTPMMIGDMEYNSVVNNWSFGVARDGMLNFYYYSNGEKSLMRTVNIAPLNEYVHISFCKDSTKAYMSINGIVESKIVTFPLSIGTSGFISIGGCRNERINGLISSIRVTKGVARYKSNFNPPTYDHPNNNIDESINFSKPYNLIGEYKK